MTEEEKALVEKLAYEVGEHVSARLKEFVVVELELHAARCPIKKDALETKARERGRMEVLRGGWAILVAFIGGLSGIVAAGWTIYVHFKGHAGQ